MKRLPCRKNRKAVVYFVVALAAFFPVVPFAQLRPIPLEYQVKAVYVYNFLKFVDWPPGTFETQSDPIHVCVIGDHPVGKALEPIESQIARGRSIQLHRLEPRDKATSCQVLFVGIRNAHFATTLLKQLEKLPVLTVSDLDHFLTLGGMISFVIEENRVVLQINLRKIRAANLQISAKILEIASRVIVE